ncbi:MAG: TIGR03009 domain-containing protein [Pirellulales bacterium]|nr:TIGR03009 domain-containing protein [Pirellulales bacterium]
MLLRTGFGTVLVGLLAIAVWLLPVATEAQTVGPAANSAASGRRPPLRPDQPVVPQYPTLQQRAPTPTPQPRAPFQLTPQQEAYLDQVLKAWEQHSARVTTFESNFTRWEYDPVFGDPNKPKYVDQGKVKYAAPDKGSFEIEGQRAEKWICDGQWIHEFNYVEKKLTQHQLPPDLRGKAIADGPLPFLFGAEAAKMKQRYFLRVIQPPEGRTGEIWLEAYPRFAPDAANFSRAELILTTRNMMPFAMDIYLPNGKSHTAYQFFGIVVNDPLRVFKGDPFRAVAPSDWQTVVRPASAPQIGQQPGRTNTR